MASKKYLLGACAAAVLGLASGCDSDVEGSAEPKSGAPAASVPSGSATGDEAAPSEHNAEDVKFAQRLLPHHEQAVVISRLAFERSADPEVTALARRIHGARGPEMKQLMALLQGWDEPVAPPNHGDSIGHGDFGLLSEEELQRLEQASGTEFDQEWLRLMTEHHEGAVEIAELELRDGVDSLAKLFAQNAVDSQNGELAELRSLAAG
ncbi:uncharacterized protein (DUF305 family) [Saccharomonospora amisosensis]|uniref:Uncharacterized protein (DUF305 family) n=1 Tax=Saccharomonospora amisosensis TaxID=1128677 RepID=A0A7X5ULG4_9PSEU|nr:DUF305 domain-containing protein [Saccharomonospora amisosensis]NIJ10171.1 uncharacterized protein (DUF305 family) [Saccharomonospora amisosensis]